MQFVRIRNLAVLTSGAVLAASLAAGPAQARPRPATDTAPSAGMAAVASGTVTGASGAAMPGATVQLIAWPSSRALGALKIGEVVPTKLLATATTSQTGSYMLQVPVAQLEAAAVDSGNANLEVFSPAGGFWFLPYQTDSLPARAPAPAIVDLSSKSKKPSCGINPDGRPYGFTGFVKERKRPQALAVVGQAYIVHSRTGKTDGDTVDFNYAQGSNSSQSTSLGIAISGYGFDAGYNSAGTHSSSARASEGFPAESKNSLFRTFFSTGQFRGICYGPPRDSNIPYQKQHGQCPHKYKDVGGVWHWVHKCIWMIHDTGWAGGEKIAHPKGAPSAQNCEPFPKNAHFDSDYGKAVQWSSGFDLSDALGIKGANLKASFDSSTQTGYDKDALLNFHFGHAGVLCGTNNKITEAAILVQRGS
jgi:hypothetical protein